MTPDQFAALAALANIRPGPALDCARRVMVDGVASSVAADGAGVSRQRVSNTLTRLRKSLALARQVCADLSTAPVDK